MKYDFKMVAVGPVSHGAFSDGIDTGNAMLFRRMTVITPDGAPVKVPAISGNALRGVMRRILTREIFYRLGLRGKADELYIAMANGGALGKTLDSYIYPEKIAAVRELVPMLSVFGGALYTYMLPGRAGVSFATLECLEAGTGPLRISDLTEDIGLTRHLDRTEVLTPEDVKPMPYTIEAVVKGAVFDFSVWTDDYATDLEKACLFHALKRLSHIGGKSAAGFGEISIDGIPDDSAYIDWLETRDQAYADSLVEYSKGMAKC